MDADSQKLLMKIGAWDAIGAYGWGEDGTESIFKKDHTFASVHEPWVSTGLR